MGTLIERAKRVSLEISGTVRTIYVLGAGKPVVCLHGFPDTVSTWTGIADRLVRAGYQVIIPVMKGYESTSADPNGDFSLPALSDDVVDLVAALKLGHTHVLGHDWGSSIGFAAVAKAPELFASFTAIAVPHPGAFGGAILNDHQQQKRSWYIFLFQLRGLAELVVGANGGQFLKQLWDDWSPGWTPDPAMLDEMAATLTQPNILASALAYYRTSFDATHPRAAENAVLLSKSIQLPVLGLHGVLDGCIGANAFQASMPLALFPKGLTMQSLNGLGHFAHLEDPEAVLTHILPFLRSNDT